MTEAAAAAYGARLLAETEQVSLHHILRDYYRQYTPQTAPLGIPALDRLVNAFRSTTVPNRDTGASAVEIVGASECSGKTQLLYMIVAVALLPAEYQGFQLGGKESAVALMDLSGRFSMLRLRDVMRLHVTTVMNGEGTILEKQMGTLMSESLMHLHIFRPENMLATLATLASLSGYLLKQPPDHFSSNRKMSLLALNDVSAFYWQDRQDAQALEAQEGFTQAHGASEDLFYRRYREFIAKLRDVQELFSCTVVATDRPLSSRARSASQMAIRPHLPPIWNNFVTVKVLVERDRVSKFRPRISLEEALLERNSRWEAVAKSGFSGWVNRHKEEEWEDAVAKALKKLKNEGAFSFKVTADGVLVDDNENDPP